MKFIFIKYFYLILLTMLLTLPMWAAAAEDSSHKSVNWSYHGDTGPSHWGDLAPEFITCKQGKNQSPVDINLSTQAKLDGIKMDYSLLVAAKKAKSKVDKNNTKKNSDLIKEAIARSQAKKAMQQTQANDNNKDNNKQKE